MATEHGHGGPTPVPTPVPTPAAALAGEVPRDAAVWAGLEETAEFKDLVRARWRFVLPATVFFLVYYFLLPLGNGLATDFMRTNVVGHVNIAYLFALSQFFVAW